MSITPKEVVQIGVVALFVFILAIFAVMAIFVVQYYGDQDQAYQQQNQQVQAQQSQFATTCNIPATQDYPINACPSDAPANNGNVEVQP